MLLVLQTLTAAAQTIYPARPSVSQSIVISQFYGGGGNSGATYTNDFVELFNRGTTAVSLSGWSVQYASATGATWQVTALTNVTVEPGKYYLVQEAAGTGGTTPLPTPDATGTIAMGATGGKVVLSNQTTALSGACPGGANIIDLIGSGGSASCFEGSAPAPAPSNTNADLRGGGGCTDTDQNGTDFTTGAPLPRNSASAMNTCSGTGSTGLSGSGAANPNAVAAGDSTLLTVTVTPATMPTSTGITVTGDLTAIGGAGGTNFFTMTARTAMMPPAITFIPFSPICRRPWLAATKLCRSRSPTRRRGRQA